MIVSKLLANDIELNPGPKCNKNHAGRKTEQMEIVYTKQLLAELTPIKHTDYKGRDYCRSCWKPLNANSRSVSCDGCSYWSHLKCTDLTLKQYQMNFGTCFSWLCNHCCEDEPEPDVKSDQRKEQTTTLNKLSGTKGLILHINCRSLNGKLDELQHFLHVVKPDLLILTETWFNESNPKGTLNFKGYRNIRKDRSQEVKQKCKRNNGGGVAIIFKDTLKVKIA